MHKLVRSLEFTQIKAEELKNYLSIACRESRRIVADVEWLNREHVDLKA